MVRRGWRNVLYFKHATAKAKAKRPLHLEKAAPSGTIENVGCELPPETKRRNLHSGMIQFIPSWNNLDRSYLAFNCRVSARAEPGGSSRAHGIPIARMRLRCVCIRW